MTALLTLLTGCIIYGGNGIERTETRELETVTALDNTTWLDVGVVTGDSTQVISATCDDNLLQYIRTAVTGGLLEIEVQDDDGVNILTDPKVDCRIDLAVATLDAITLTGSGDLALSGASPTLREVSMSGSGDAIFDGLATAQLGFLTSGSGDVTASGTTGGVDLISSGSGDLLTRDLVAIDGVVLTSGSGDVEIHATGSLTIDTSGSGDVDVWGSPQSVQSDTSGSGDVAFHDD